MATRDCNTLSTKCLVGCNDPVKAKDIDKSFDDLPTPTIPDSNYELPTVKDVTEEIVSGNGVFDVYMKAGKNQLDTQYKLGRIKGSDYTAAYVAMQELMMTEANKFVLALAKLDMESKMLPLEIEKAKKEIATAQLNANKLEAEAELVLTQTAELTANGTSKRKVESADICVKDAMSKLYMKQAEGFDDKARNDAAKTISNMWTIFISEVYDGVEATPGVLGANGMNTMLNDLGNKVDLNIVST